MHVEHFQPTGAVGAFIPAAAQLKPPTDGREEVEAGVDEGAGEALRGEGVGAAEDASFADPARGASQN